jgi:HD-GYP domain-containing protein (c-di-GMP phosphodiesterase class II)
MTTFHARRFRLQNLLAAVLLLLTLAAVGTLARIAYVKFEDMAQASAELVFAQQVQRGNELFTGLFSRTLAQVNAVAAQGTPSEAALLRQWMAVLAADEAVHSLHLTSTDGTFVQSIALREQSMALALGAPDGARYANRLVGAAGPDGRRPETWRFIDGSGQQLAERAGTTGFDGWQNLAVQAAMARPDVLVGRPAPFLTTRATGVTVARRLADRSGVVAAEISVAGIAAMVGAMAQPPHAVSALIDPSGRALVAGTGRDAATKVSDGPPALPAQPGAALLALDRWRAAGPVPEVRRAVVDGTPYVVAQSTLELAPGDAWRFVTYAPSAGVFGYLFATRDQLALLCVLVMACALLVALLVTKYAMGPLQALASDARRLCHRDFGPAPRLLSRVEEFCTLAEAQAVARESMQAGTEDLHDSRRRMEELISAGLAMSRERNKMNLLQQILWNAKRLTRCDAATLYIVTEQRSLRFALRTREDPLPQDEIPLYASDGQENTHFVSVHVALRNEHVVIDDVYQETRFDLGGTRSFDETTGYRTVSMLALPLAPREGEVIGVLQLMNALDPITGKAVAFSAQDIELASALAAQAAVSLDNHQLVQAQADLVDSMVKMLAGAIDAKSAHTGGHCERVPELAMMLAEEASRCSAGPLAAFRFTTPEQWREFRIGAWLHDCGKITTPEYVVDKATKLETLYDRLHEVRTRFEVLWRDAEIAYLKACLTGTDAPTARARRDARQAELQEDFAFVARCNLGAESMEQDDITRLHSIGEQIWWRHFDDRIGLGHEAQAALAQVPASPLPAMERLLDDKPQHIVPRPAGQAQPAPQGFNLQAPQHLYNRGELHNLSVGRGTLTAEERHKINEHITQTIVMLESINFPVNLQRVPEYAGTHHETLQGTGYPRGLTAEQLSVPARIMAIADIFEALTASDRPYKKSKSLSEAVEILWGFKQRGHIDPDLFDLFLSSGTYLRFARRFLSPDLVDAVDIARYLGPVRAPLPKAAAAPHCAGSGDARVTAPSAGG